jgi:flavin-dependent dehydrogenase
MESCDALIVGGGPAGSTCAGRLRRGGFDVVVLDKATFPRQKVCAGWITPRVLQSLELDPVEYGKGRVLQAMTAFRVGCGQRRATTVSYGRPVSFGVCRREFDDFLLRRSGARLRTGEPLRSIERAGADWLVNGEFHAPILVAAGGHFCPVARLLGMAAHQEPIVAAEEFEIELTPREQAASAIDPQVPEIYFCDDLLGYGWCIRKGPLLNVGLGREDRRGLPERVRRFGEFLRREGRIAADLPDKFQGHAYQLYDHSTRPLWSDGVVWLGDAAGLAHTRSGEGIGPAVVSGLLAAAVILHCRGDYRAMRLAEYGRRIEARFGRRRVGRAIVAPPSAFRRMLAQRLLASRWFVRRVVLDRWFLRA